jgi:hypothetical protein
MTLLQRHQQLSEVRARAASSWCFHQCSDHTWGHILNAPKEELLQLLSIQQQLRAQQQLSAQQLLSAQQQSEESQWAAECQHQLAKRLLVTEGKPTCITFISDLCRHNIELPTWSCLCCGQVCPCAADAACKPSCVMHCIMMNGE